MAVETKQAPEYRPVIPLWAVLLAVAVGFGVYYYQNRPEDIYVHWVSIEEGERQWQQGQKPVLYYFGAAWCGPCKLLRAEVFGDREIAGKINEFFIPVKVIDRSHEDGRNPDDIMALDMKYDVHAFPTLVVRMPNDQARINQGYGEKDMTVRFLQGVLALWMQERNSSNH